MYIHVGNDIVVNTKDIIGIFDMDNTTVSRQGKSFLPHAQKDGIIINATDDLPRSYVVAEAKGKQSVYISSYTTQALEKHAKNQ